MTHAMLVTVYLLIYSVSYAQEQEGIIAALEQHAAITAENGGIEMEDDSFLLQLEHLRKHPINLNEAQADDLKMLPEITDLQIENFLSYRRLFGNLIDIYELQAVPTWNISLIKKLQPFVIVALNAGLVSNVSERVNNGSHHILVRSSWVLEKAAGYREQSDSVNHFLGPANRLMIRYLYRYRNLLSWGFSGDKDGGEPFFNRKQQEGFDFYSFHFFLAKLGIIKSLAIGDFTINMGQGLIQWQSLAFSKSAEITSVKRQSALLHPYTATGEVNFHRGAAISLQKGKWEGSAFFSRLKGSSNVVKDSITDEGHVTSILSSGYHRTPAEMEDRHNLLQVVVGASMKYATDKWHLALNAVQYKFSLPLKKEDKPYNRYAPSGKIFGNASIDHSYTYKNLHFFGELAVDRNGSTAMVSGLLAAISSAADVSLVYRSIDKSYQSFNANAFTENSDPINEKGLFAGITVRPAESIRLNAYADHYHFPWLKYRVSAPSYGREYFIQLMYNPNKQVALYSYFRSERKQQDVSDSRQITDAPDYVTKQNWRLHADITINRSMSVRSRAEIIFYNKKQPGEEEGFLMFADFLYKSASAHWSGNIRAAYFETNGYDSRIYAFENDVLYNFSIPAVFDKGHRYYINLNVDVSKFARRFISKQVTAACWMKFAQTIFDKKESIGTGLDQINGNKKTDLKLQLMIGF